MQAKGEWTRLEDIRALELYTRLRQAPSLYNPSPEWCVITSAPRG